MKKKLIKTAEVFVKSVLDALTSKHTDTHALISGTSATSTHHPCCTTHSFKQTNGGRDNESKIYY